MGIDIGTSGTTTLIIDETGKVLSKGKVTYSCSYIGINQIEQDLNILWSQIVHSIRMAIEKLSTSDNFIDAISIASQRGSFIVVDNKGTPISNAIIWSDRRAVHETNELINKIGDIEYYKKVGSYPNVLWTSSKIMWFENKNPNQYKYINELEWVGHKLGCKDFITSPSTLSQNGMMDINTFDWQEDIISAMGISKMQLPKIKPSGTIVGTVSDIVARKTGLKEGTPILLGGGDQQMASVGTGSIDENSIHLSLGTGGAIISHSNKLPNNMKNLMIGSHIFDNVWTKETIILSAGNSYDWVRKMLNIKSLNEMEKIVENSVIGSNGVLFFPYLSGDMGILEDSKKSGAYIGITLNTKQKDIIRATMEGVANEIALKLSYFNTTCDKINVTGDCFKSKVWGQIIANQTNKELVIFEEGEATALGAAISAGVYSSIFTSFEEACKITVKEKKRIKPNKKEREKSDTLYKRFIKCYDIFKNY